MTLKKITLSKDLILALADSQVNEAEKETKQQKDNHATPEGLRQQKVIERKAEKNNPPWLKSAKENRHCLIYCTNTLKSAGQKPNLKGNQNIIKPIGIKLGHSAKQKIRAAKKLIALVENKPFRGKKIQSLNADDYNALTHSRLGQLTQPCVDILQGYNTLTCIFIKPAAADGFRL